jgi:DNA-binding NarL/FixJ family response regulator
MGHLNDVGAKSVTNVFVLTENRLVRESLTRLLQKRQDLNVAGASGFRDFDFEAIVTSGCDVLVMDRLSSPDDRQMIQDLAARMPALKVVLFGMADNCSLFLESARLGVSGYLLHDASASEIVASVRAVSHGDAACPPKLCMALIQYVAEHSSSWHGSKSREVELRPSLTHRQIELVDLLAKGMTNKQIAANLNLSEFTVKNHLRRIMRQIEADDRHHVVRMIRDRGVDLHP